MFSLQPTCGMAEGSCGMERSVPTSESNPKPSEATSSDSDQEHIGCFSCIYSNDESQGSILSVEEDCETAKGQLLSRSDEPAATSPQKCDNKDAKEYFHRGSRFKQRKNDTYSSTMHTAAMEPFRRRQRSLERVAMSSSNLRSNANDYHDLAGKLLVQQQEKHRNIFKLS